MEQKPSRSDRRARRIPRALAVPRQGRRQRPAAVPAVRHRAAGASRRQISARSSPAPTIPNANSPGSSGRAASRPRPTGPTELGNGIELKVGRFGPYLERDGKRASIPKDVPQGRHDGRDGRAIAVAAARRSATIPRAGCRSARRSGAMGLICCTTANMPGCRRPPEVFETGMNAAVVKLAEAAAVEGRARGGARAAGGAWRAPGVGQGNQGDGGQIRPLRQRRHDPRHPAQDRRSQGGDAG